MSLRDQVKLAIEQGQTGQMSLIEKLVAEEPRAVRHLLGLTYHPDSKKRKEASIERRANRGERRSLMQDINDRATLGFPQTP